MADVNAQIQDNIKSLHDDYQRLAWYKKWFFPSSVKKIFSNYSEENQKSPQYVSSLYQALFHQTSNWQRWIFTCLNAWFKTDVNNTLLSSKLITNNDHGTLNCKTVIQHETPTEFIQILHEYHPLTKGHYGVFIREALANHETPELLSKGFQELEDLGLIISDDQGLANCQALQEHDKPAEYAQELCKLIQERLRQKSDIACEQLKQDKYNKALNTLKKAELLNDNTREALEYVSNPQSLADVLCTLKDNGFFNNNEQINTILGICKKYQDNAPALFNVLCQLKNLNLLNDDEQGQANYNTLLSHRRPLSFAKGLLHLKQHGFLNSDEQIATYRNSLCNYYDPLILAKTLCQLAAVGLLSNDQQGRENHDVICQNNFLELLSEYFASLNKETNNQHNFDQLITHQIILADVPVLSAFSNIPCKLRTQKLFDKLFNLANQNKNSKDSGKDAILAYLNTFKPKLSKNTDSTTHLHRNAFFQNSSTSSSSSAAQPQPNFV